MKETGHIASRTLLRIDHVIFQICGKWGFDLKVSVLLNSFVENEDLI
jgi:hypothetical protein